MSDSSVSSDLTWYICTHAACCCLCSDRSVALIVLFVVSFPFLFSFLSLYPFVLCVVAAFKTLWMLQLLQYHVVPGMAMTTSTLTNGQTLTTALTGQTLKVWTPLVAS